MKNKSLTIITEGGKEFGFGHITRCLSIAKVFKDYNYQINFIINGDKSIDSILDDTNYTLFDWVRNTKQLFIDIEKSSLLLVDSIKISDELLIQLEKINTPVIFIDDEKRRNILNSGFVIDWTVLSEQQNHFIPKKKSVNYLLGSIYTPLRAEFTKASKNIIKKDLQTLMITFGGADVRDLTPKILRTLTKEFPEIQKNIVIGAGFTNIDEIEKSKDNNTNLIYNANTQTMIKLMQDSDLAIASGGQTLYELAKIGTPTIAILLVNNAQDDTLGWDRVGTIKNIGWYNDEILLDNLITEMKNIKNYHTRKQMQENAKDYINSDGAKFLVDSIVSKL